MGLLNTLVLIMLVVADVYGGFPRPCVQVDNHMLAVQRAWLPISWQTRAFNDELAPCMCLTKFLLNLRLVINANVYLSQRFNVPSSLVVAKTAREWPHRLGGNG